MNYLTAGVFGYTLDKDLEPEQPPLFVVKAVEQTTKIYFPNRLPRRITLQNITSPALPNTLDYNLPVEIAPGVFWVGFYDRPSGLHCNPYLIVDNDEAVVIDGGSRPDFPVVMMKILQSGIEPGNIKALIYHHYDPDLVGSIQTFEDLIGDPELRIISDKENNMFIRHYSVSSPLLSLEAVEHCFRFSSGRTLRFINTPYSHSPGSLITFDETSGILFTSDLFGSYGKEWNLYLHLDQECRSCVDFPRCPHDRSYCPLADFQRFHRKIMTSERALRLAMARVRKIPCTMIAPQHGSIITKPEDIHFLQDLLASMTGIGIDGLPEEG